MQKTISFILIVCVLTAMFLTACSQTGTDVSPLPSLSPTVIEPSPSDSTPPPETPDESEAPATTSPDPDFVFGEEVYTNDTVTIKYPQIVDYPDAALEETLNTLIANAAKQGVDELEEGTEYEVDYTVSLSTPGVISVWFDGYYFMPGTAHPSLLLFAVTVDVAGRRTVTLPEFITIDSDFVAQVREGELSSTGFDITDEIRDILLEDMSDDDLMMAELNGADTSIWSAASYLTPDALVLSLPVAHVLGDHVEISVPYDKLAPFMTEHSVWDALGVR